MLTVFQRMKIIEDLIQISKNMEIPKSKETSVSNNELLFHLGANDEDKKNEVLRRMEVLKSEDIVVKTPGGGGGVWRWKENKISESKLDIDSQQESFFYQYVEAHLPKFLEFQFSGRKYVVANIANKRGSSQQGRYSRPDFIAVGLWTSQLTGQREIFAHSIEVKTANNFSISSALETSAHRLSVGSNYLLICNADGDQLEHTTDWNRSLNFCWENELGLITALDTEDTETWDLFSHARDCEFTPDVEKWILEHSEIHPKLRKLGLNVPK